MGELPRVQTSPTVCSMLIIVNFVRNLPSRSNDSKSKSASPIITSSVPACITPTQVSSTTSNVKLDPNEPPTKLIKLINGSAILAPMDKDNKMLHSGQLTLQQVMVIKLSKLGNGAFNECLIAGRWRWWLSRESYSAVGLVARIQGHRTAEWCHHHRAQHATQ